MTTELPTIELIELSTLICDNALSGRNEKELEENAKEKLPILLSSGGWIADYPGTYFERDSAKHLLAGFSRRLACIKGGITHGYFIKVDDDYQWNKVACITSNCGKPISMFEQGRIYEDMLAWPDEDGPWTSEKIAKHVGYSKQHIDNCLGIFHETPEIAELIASGLVSMNAVVKARQQVKDDAKRFKYLKAAIEEANGHKATEKHLDAVKSKFVKVKAAQSKGEKGQSAQQTSEPPSPSVSVAPPDTFTDTTIDDSVSQEPAPSLNLPEVAPVVKSQKAVRVAYRTIIEDWSNANGIDCNDGHIAKLVDLLLESDNAPF